MWTHSSPDSTVVGHKWWTYQEKTHSLLLRIKAGACKHQWATSKPIEILPLFLGIWIVFFWMLRRCHSLYITIPFPPSPLLLEFFIFIFVYNCIIEIKENYYWCHTYSFLSLIWKPLCCSVFINKLTLRSVGCFICASKVLNVWTREQKLLEAVCWSLIHTANGQMVFREGVGKALV